MARLLPLNEAAYLHHLADSLENRRNVKLDEVDARFAAAALRHYVAFLDAATPRRPLQ